jgi:uncharacterized protein (TIGR02328 family)
LRLWSQQLLSYLPRQQLLGQHRECCALRGNGWGRPHKTVNYIFKHSPYLLYQYHLEVMVEMSKRGYHADIEWFDEKYRGKACYGYVNNFENYELYGYIIYPEHDNNYLQECLDNLKRKGIEISL